VASGYHVAVTDIGSAFFLAAVAMPLHMASTGFYTPGVKVPN
jgi:hypothetical protein